MINPYARVVKNGGSIYLKPPTDLLLIAILLPNGYSSFFCLFHGLFVILVCIDRVLHRKRRERGRELDILLRVDNQIVKLIYAKQGQWKDNDWRRQLNIVVTRLVSGLAFGPFVILSSTFILQESTFQRSFLRFFFSLVISSTRHFPLISSYHLHPTPPPPFFLSTTSFLS